MFWLSHVKRQKWPKKGGLPACVSLAQFGKPGEMLAYDYVCLECGETTEFHLESFEQKDKFEPKCPKCGSEKMKRVFTPMSFAIEGASCGVGGPCSG